MGKYAYILIPLGVKKPLKNGLKYWFGGDGGNYLDININVLKANYPET